MWYMIFFSTFVIIDLEQDVVQGECKIEGVSDSNTTTIVTLEAKE